MCIDIYAKDDKKLPVDHPKRIFMDRYNGYLNSDCFSKNSEMKFLYETDELLKFISACLDRFSRQCTCKYTL